jgi:hypothetical protein
MHQSYETGPPRVDGMRVAADDHGLRSDLHRQ